MLNALSVFLFLSAFAATAGAQQPSVPPPPSSRAEGAGPEVHELLPDIGRIGAEVGLVGGVSWNPYRVGRGLVGGGFVDLPIGRAPGGKLSYEIFLGLSWAQSDDFAITEGASRRTVHTRLRLLQVAPFALKYTVTRWDRARVRPYLGTGIDVLVPATREEPMSPERAPEISDRGVATGDVSVEVGGHGAAGLELRLSSGLSLGFEYRFTVFEGRNARLHSVSSILGIHW